jgi:hypothetical protein
MFTSSNLVINWVYQQDGSSDPFLSRDTQLHWVFLNCDTSLSYFLPKTSTKVLSYHFTVKDRIPFKSAPSESGSTSQRIQSCYFFNIFKWELL